VKFRTATVIATVAAALAPLVTASSALAWKPPPAMAHSVVKKYNVPVRMSDRVILHVNVIRPAKRSGGPVRKRLPVLLTQTPYNNNSPKLNFEDSYLVEHGYVQVIADVRGTGSSEGMWSPFGRREQRDGYELAEWAGRQPWSDGRIGLHGTSYGAINQILTSEENPPGVMAAFPIVPMADAYRDVTFGGGTVNTSFIPVWLGLVNGLGLVPPTYTTNNPLESARVLVDHSGGALSFQSDQILDAAGGGNAAYDGPFYRIRSPIDRIGQDHIPTFIVGGWFDLFQRGEPLLYQALHRHGVPTRLLMGPWYHITAGRGLPAKDVPSLNNLELRWMDHFVKGIPDPGLKNRGPVKNRIAPVTYFENGAGLWRTTSGWYSPNTSFKPLFLSGPAGAHSPGKLVFRPVKGQKPDTLTYNPATGPCSRSSVEGTAGVGASLPCETGGRANDATSLSYDIPMEHELHLLGPMAVQLWVSSFQARDSMITARVEDVAPDGKATQISAGWDTLSLRALAQKRTVYSRGFMTMPFHPFTQRSILPIPNGKPVEVDLEIYPTGWDVRGGHKLRVTLQEADVPHLFSPLPTSLVSVGANLSIYHDRTHRSALITPVLEAGF
jgi:uncharacterized protein